MDERRLHDHITPEAADGEASDELALLLSCAEPQPVSDVDVARLRRAVRRQVATEMRGRRGGGLLRKAMLAAAAASFAGATMLAWVGERPAAAPAPPVSVARAADGSVVIQFADRSRVHRVTKTAEPQPGAEGEVRVARQRFVDRNDAIRPGEVVFYRID